MDSGHISLSKIYSDRQKRGIAICIIVTVSFFVATLLAYSFMTRHIDKTQDEYVETMISNSFSGIENYISELSYSSERNTMEISNAIKDSIFKSYKDLSVLEKEMENKDYTNLAKLVTESTDKLESEDLYGDGLIIGTKDGVLYNSNYRSNLDGDKEFETWEDLINLNYNKDLAREAYVEGFSGNPKKHYIFIEPTQSKYNNHKYYKEMDINTLQEIYRTEGLEGLKTYELVTISYIEHDRDIFGNRELVGGVRQNTHRLVIVQFCNIYDQIILNKSYLQISINTIKNNKDNLMSIVYSIGIIMIIAFLIMLIPIAIIFNTFVIGKNEDEYERDKLEKKET